MSTILQALNISPIVLVEQVVAFIALVIILNIVFWKPMLRHLAARRQAVSDAYDAVEKTRSEMEELRRTYQAQIAEAEAQARSHIQETIRAVQAEREAQIAKARAEAEAAFRSAAAAHEQERQTAIRAFQSDIERLAGQAVSKVLPADGSVPLNQDLIRKLIAEQASTGTTGGSA